MKRTAVLFGVLLFAALLVAPSANAQTTGMVGIKLGLGLADGNAGFLIGPGGEVIFGKHHAVGSEINIVTSTGTPVEWFAYYKYIFTIPKSMVRPYADGGLSLIFMTGGPYFGFRFGGGSLFQVAKDFNLMADLQLGPTFASSGAYTSGIFVFTITVGVRYELH